MKKIYVILIIFMSILSLSIFLKTKERNESLNKPYNFFSNQTIINNVNSTTNLYFYLVNSKRCFNFALCLS